MMLMELLSYIHFCLVKQRNNHETTYVTATKGTSESISGQDI